MPESLDQAVKDGLNDKVKLVNANTMSARSLLEFVEKSSLNDDVTSVEMSISANSTWSFETKLADLNYKELPEKKRESLEMSPSYMLSEFSPEEMAEVLEKDLEFDTLVGTGTSGYIVPVLAHILGVKYFLVRKPNSSVHTSRVAQGSLGKKWVFVDDLMDTGETFLRVHWVIDKLCEVNNFESEMTGHYLYNSDPYVGHKKLPRGRASEIRDSFNDSVFEKSYATELHRGGFEL